MPQNATPNGTSLSDSCCATFSAAGTYILRVSVDDGHGGSVTSDVTVVASGPGDLNGNGVVNIEDLAMVTSHFGQVAGDPFWDPQADANGDGAVNITDLTSVTPNFGKTY